MNEEEEKKGITVEEWKSNLDAFETEQNDVLRLKDATLFFLSMGNPPNTALANALNFCRGDQHYDYTGVPGA